MPLKSILRAVGARFSWSGTDLADLVRRGSQPELDRLTSRSDWAPESRPVHAGFRTHVAPPWPATDDPYAKPELCEVVPDPAFDNLKGVGRVTDLIDRQEAAEKLLRIMGWQWDKNQKSWQAPIL